MFKYVDFNNFWDETAYVSDRYCEPLPTERTIAEVETALDIKLPKSYIFFMSLKNGGIPKKNACPCESPTYWSTDHIAIASFLAIGKQTDYSLLGKFGHKFMVDAWGYPDIGLAICTCPSGGHDMVFLDYRHCGRHMEKGEPAVVYVEQEADYKISFLAPNFEEFIKLLRSEDSYDIDDEEKTFHLLTDVKNSPLWPELKELVNSSSNPVAVNHWLRSIAAGAVQENQSLTPKDDQLSRRLFDILLWITLETEQQALNLSQVCARWAQILKAGIHDTDEDMFQSAMRKWISRRRNAGEIILYGEGDNATSTYIKFSDEYSDYLKSQVEAVAALLPADPEMLADFFIDENRHRQIIEAFELLPESKLTPDLLAIKAIAHNNVGEYKTAYEILVPLDDKCSDKGKHAYRKGFSLYFGAKHYCNSQALAQEQAQSYFSLLLAALKEFEFAITVVTGPMLEQCKVFVSSIKFEAKQFYGREAQELNAAFDPSSAFNNLATVTQTCAVKN